MTRNWLVLFLLLASTFVRSQGYLNEILPRDGHYGLWSLNSIEVKNNGFWVVGSQYHPSTGNGVCTLMSLNSSGEIDTTIFLTTPIEVSISPSILIHEDFIYVVVNYKPTLESNGSTPMLIKFDFEGNEVWRYNYSTPERVFARDIKITSDNNLIMWGQIATLPGNSYPRCFYIRQFNLDGILLWDKTYWPSYNANANDLIETSDGGLMISGFSKRHFLNEFQFRVIKTDALGDVIWDKDLGVSGYMNGGGTISELPDGSFVCSTFYGNEDILGSLVNPKGRIVIIDSEGNILRQQDYVYGSTTTMQESVVLNDGTIIVIGVGLNQFNEQYVNLLKFDPMGNIIWQREYTNLPNLPSRAYTLKKTDNNGLLFAGSTWVETDVSFQQRAWLVKTDCFGCDSLLCYYEDSTCLVYDCNEYPTNPQFTVSDPVFSTSTGTTFTFTQNQTSNTTMRYWDLGDGTTQMGAQNITHTYTQAGTYTVKLRSHHSACFDEFEQTVVVTQNIGEAYAIDSSGKFDDVANVGLENWQQEFRVYPNPVSQMLNIEFADVKGALFVTDLLGQVKYTKNDFAHFTTINTEDYYNGVYIVMVIDDETGNRVSSRFIVLK